MIRSTMQCLLFGLLAVFVACGNSESDGASATYTGVSNIVTEDAFTPSKLPADFPRDLIPPDYASASYANLGAVATAAFESEATVHSTVEHYIDLLGSPTLDATSDDGERMAQWQTQPWSVSVTGGPSGSSIGITKVGAQ